MVTTPKKSGEQTWTWSGAGFTRQTPSEKQTAAPESSLLYKRARYYDPNTGEFISRDPLGFVDGMSQYRGYFVPSGMDPSGLSGNSKEPWNSHHWFVQALRNALKSACGDFQIDDYATDVLSDGTGSDHDFIHNMGGYDFNNLQAGRVKGRPFLDKSLNYNVAAQEVVDRAGGDCCALINGMIQLIDSYWTLLNYYRIETMGPQAYVELQMHPYRGKLGDGDGITKLLEYQEVVCRGRRRPSDPVYPGNFQPNRPPCISIPKENNCYETISLKYSPYYRHQQYSRSVNGSWNARTELDIEREAGRLSRQLNYGLLPKTADEIQSEYSNEALERNFPGSLERGRTQREIQRNINNRLRARVNQRQRNQHASRCKR